MLTKPQISKYWRTWSAVCKAQGWRTGDDDARYDVHAAAGCPQSMRGFSNRHFSRFLEHCETLLGNVDIRDRDRENAEWTVQRLRGAILDIMGQEEGEAYLREIIITLTRGSYDLDSLPLESANHRDLQNIKKTLKNRLSKIITRIKNGQLDRPALARMWGDTPNNAIIADIIRPQPRRKPPARVPVREISTPQPTPAPF